MRLSVTRLTQFLSSCRHRLPRGDALASRAGRRSGRPSDCQLRFWPQAFYAVPVETYTFMFTDIEGSTALLGRVEQGVYAGVLADHHAIIRSGLAGHGGREVDTQGDSFFAVFSSPTACVAAVVAMQQATAGHAWPGGEQVRVRMGVHTGQASKTARAWSAWMYTAPPGWPRPVTAARCCCRRHRPRWCGRLFRRARS